MENAALGLIRGPPCLSILSDKLSSNQAFGSDQGGDGLGDGGDGGDGAGVVDGGELVMVMVLMRVGHGSDGQGLGTVIDVNFCKGPEN